MSASSPINVLFIASEADPFVKVGGLADVAGSLPRALKALNPSEFPPERTVDIRLVIPFHPQIQQELYRPQKLTEYPIRTLNGYLTARVYFFEHAGLPVYLLGGDPVDQETGVYSANLEADGYKYVFFSLSCLEMAKQIGWKPDILHANDWHTATAVYALALQRTEEEFFSGTKSLLTVHNLPYLGAMTPAALGAFGLPSAKESDLPSWANQMALPLGLLAADKIIAVSPGYAKEILTEEYGSGLDAFLNANSAKIFGILNGLDTHKWNPSADTEIASVFSPDTLHQRIANKAFLQTEMGLAPDPNVTVLAMVTRMDPQKGVDLAIVAIKSLLQSAEAQAHPIQMIFLGTGNPVLESEARLLEHDFPASVRARIMFNERLSRLIYSGADILLMPSRYEPCGLSQMIAMHYGCVPIARNTGGLCDTIHDPDLTEQSTGFLFGPAKSGALENSILRALSLFENNPAEWQKMQLRGMQYDFSWISSARTYLNQYMSLLG